ncbi:RNA polymerase sigma factor [Arcticibacter tournemirensis]|uniref:Sigma-70 family RNA polymerase sigma factor n=1 Tax=Arcticibacter tournemirensis TaxID=699437 RepID=A0A4Q0MAE5_9SPHI|nr:sigma-70 family RNA polymerase sigma factor [Arcticibacter tournemirensis]RXF70221.1 sigma-70 family RNA polymerase sigma factor [Arcticibacter tournemirensis]
MQLACQIEDKELLHLIKQNDTSAFKILYDRYWKDLYVKACKRVDEDSAKDLIQEIMTTFWRRRNTITLSKKGDVAAYLHTALRYRIISYYAYTASEIKKTAVFDFPADLSIPNTLEIKELKEIIELEVGKLPHRMQQVFRMSREFDYSISDIAMQLNLSEQTVKNQLSEALKRLRISIQARTAMDWVLVLAFLFYH